MKNKILSVLFLITIFSIMLLGIIIPDKDISVSERRKLSKFPSLEIETIMNGEFFEDLNKYFIEHFPFRDFFRNIKGTISTNIFQKKDEDGIFIKDNGIYQLNTSLNEESVNHFTKILNKIQNRYLRTENIYYAIIPDKNYFLDDNIPKLDYQKLELLLNKNLNNMNYIDIFDTLDLDSYYKTDIHWQQEKLVETVNKIEESINLSKTSLPTKEKKHTKFYGALYGRIANNLKSDVITYLTSNEIENASVFDYEKQEYRKVYEYNDLTNIDTYDIYLGGAKPLLIIENKNQTNNKELILFRDSFGSSIAPLLIPNYSKITLIDLRYLSSDLLKNIQEINLNSQNQDVLFLYSVPIINNSFTLK